MTTVPECSDVGRTLKLPCPSSSSSCVAVTCVSTPFLTETISMFSAARRNCALAIPNPPDLSIAERPSFNVPPTVKNTLRTVSGVIPTPLSSKRRHLFQSSKWTLISGFSVFFTASKEFCNNSLVATESTSPL